MVSRLSTINFWSKFCFALAALAFGLAVFSVPVGTLALIPAGLFFVALGLLLA